jgi:hypothetical protein
MAFGHHRYASNAEHPDSDKKSHESVGYETKSTHASERCGNCHNLIQSMPLRCVGVKSPIAAGAWCQHWERD